MAVFSCLKSDEDARVEGKKPCFLKRVWKGLKRRLRRRANRERKILKEMVANAERPKIVRKEIKESDDVYEMIRELKTCDCWYYPDLFKPHFVKDRNETPEVKTAQLEAIPEEIENTEDSECGDSEEESDEGGLQYEIADIERVLDGKLDDESDSEDESKLKYELADIERVLDVEPEEYEEEESELKYEIADIDKVLDVEPEEDEEEEESELKYEIADIERVLDDAVDESDSDEESGLLYEIEDIERVLDQDDDHNEKEVVPLETEEVPFLKSFEKMLGPEIFKKFEKEIEIVSEKLDKALSFWVEEYKDYLVELPISKSRIIECMGVLNELLLLKFEDKMGIDTL